MPFYLSTKFYISCILSMTASGLTFAEDQNLEPMFVVETRTPQPLSETSPWGETSTPLRGVSQGGEIQGVKPNKSLGRDMAVSHLLLCPTCPLAKPHHEVKPPPYRRGSKG